MNGALNTIRNEHRSLAAILRAMHDLVVRIRDGGMRPDFEGLRATLYFLDIYLPRSNMLQRALGDVKRLLKNLKSNLALRGNRKIIKSDSLLAAGSAAAAVRVRCGAGGSCGRDLVRLGLRNGG